MKEDNREQRILIDNRSSISVSGVSEVISYDEKNIVMETNMGQLALDGSGLNIVKLNSEEGCVSVTGKLDALYYMEQKGKRSLFSRLFG